MLGAEYRHIRMAGAPDALPLVRAAFPDAEVVVHERLCPLEIATKPIRLSAVPERAAVVAFSRRAVYHVAGLLRRAGRRPAVLYGAMPPEVRRHEVARFVAGEADVVVATDVIGHGINLPVAAVIFAETEKFDGVSRRELSAWEVAQIAGRAGRFGLEPSGIAAALTGVFGPVGSPQDGHQGGHSDRRCRQRCARLPEHSLRQARPEP
ncbi:helicase domain-containing protein, partial [mine drainage metagenome]